MPAVKFLDLTVFLLIREAVMRLEGEIRSLDVFYSGLLRAGRNCPNINARDGGRTRTPLAGLRILSPVRLPVPPPGRIENQLLTGV